MFIGWKNDFLVRPTVSTAQGAVLGEVFAGGVSTVKRMASARTARRCKSTFLKVKTEVWQYLDRLRKRMPIAGG